LACEPDISVARLAMEHGVNPNRVFKWRRALRAGEYDPVDLLPVTVEAPAQEIEQPAPALVGRAAPAGAIEISVGNTRVRIEGSPHAATLLLVPRMLRGTSGPTA
ncbi:transposase, partial [Burkholderia pseudomallei]